MNALDCDQGSAAWFEARLGKVTASRVGDVIKVLARGGYAAERAKYRDQLVVERLTGVVAQSFVSTAMARGSAMELEAANAYEFMHDVTIQRVGFVFHPTIADSGASPDGLVGEDGVVEFKCPNSATHVDTLLTREIPEHYRAQIQWVLACTGRAWCDYVSFDPRMLQLELRTFERRVLRDETTIAALEMAVACFLGEVEDKVARLLSLGRPQVAEAALAGA